MHMMIMSLCVGTPVLPIAYEFKTKELSKRIGIADLLLDIDTITEEAARKNLATFVADLDHYRNLSLQAVLAEHTSAMSATQFVTAVAASLSSGAENIAPRSGKNAA
jgi:colanic acid/amylovoran biosynthesis protein